MTEALRAIATASRNPEEFLRTVFNNLGSILKEAPGNVDKTRSSFFLAVFENPDAPEEMGSLVFAGTDDANLPDDLGHHVRNSIEVAEKDDQTPILVAGILAATVRQLSKDDPTQDSDRKDILTGVAFNLKTREEGVIMAQPDYENDKMLRIGSVAEITGAALGVDLSDASETTRPRSLDILVREFMPDTYEDDFDYANKNE